MMMRPRRYSTLNRACAKAIGHSINNYYRNKSKTTYSNSSSNNNTDDDAFAVGCFTVFVIIGIFIYVISQILASA